MEGIVCVHTVNVGTITLDMENKISQQVKTTLMGRDFSIYRWNVNTQSCHRLSRFNNSKHLYPR